MAELSLGKIVDVNQAGQAFDRDLLLEISMLNRHGLITGATGTGKTVTLQKLAEGLAAEGVPVLLTDVKGDLSGIAEKGVLNDKIKQRSILLNYTYTPRENQVNFWDLYAEKGLALRTTLSEFGPLLLSKALALNQTQTQALELAFLIADKQGFLLIDLKDLKAVLNWISDNAADLKEQYGSVASVTINTIMRAINTFQAAGADNFFSEPALDLSDMIYLTKEQEGIINILDSASLINDARLYSSFLLWLLSELFEELPEVGDLEKPKLVLFFDEAHLIFDNLSDALLEKIEQVVRLIRSKGVGVVFITQNQADIPEKILAQLGLRIQHALRAYTPTEQKALKSAAKSFYQNPAFSCEAEIQKLEVGEALVSALDKKARPQQVEKIMIYPPLSKIGAIDQVLRASLISNSTLKQKYSENSDRESAFELLKKRQNRSAADAASNERQTGEQGGSLQESSAKLSEILFGNSRRQGALETLFKSTIRTVGNRIGREIVRGVLGGMRRR